MKGKSPFLYFQLLLVGALLLHFLYLSNLMTGWLNPCFNDAMHRLGMASDFFQFYQSGSDLAAGRSIYTDTTHRVVPYLCWNHYPPVVAMTIGQGAILFDDPFTAYYVWIGIIEVMLILAVWLTAKTASSPRDACVTCSMWLAFSPFAIDLYMGQMNTVIGCLLFFTLVAGLREKRVWETVAFAAAALGKMNALWLAPAYVRLKRWLPLIVAGLLLLAANLPHFLSKPADAEYFLDYVFLGPDPFDYHAGNLGLAALVYEATESTPAVRICMYLFVAASLFFTFRAKRPEPLHLFSLWMVTYFLGFRFIWEHHYMVLVPVFVLLYQKHRGWWIGIAYLLAALPTPLKFIDVDLGPGFTDPEVHWSLGVRLGYHAIKPIAVLMLYGFLVRRLMGRDATEKANMSPGGSDQ
jgi:hypothetical protein